MGRHEEKRRKRAGEALTRALRRGEAEPALAALLDLPPDERSAHSRAVGDLVTAAVAADFRAHRWDRLGFWAARIERCGGWLDDESGELRWAFFWGSARTGAWARATALVDGLAGRLPAALVDALRGYVAAAGTPAPEDLDRWVPPALTVAEAADPRLGYDRGQVPVAPAGEPEAPVRPDEVEERVLAAWASLGWNRFTTMTGSWAARTPALARPIRLLAAQLSVRTLLVRARAADAGWEQAARFIAAACEDLNRPEELREAMALAVRVSLRGGNGTVGGALTACRMAKAALGYSDLASLAATAFCDLPKVDLHRENVVTPDEERLAREMLALGQRLLERHPDPHLFWHAMRVWEGAGDEPKVPGWLGNAVSTLLADGADLGGGLLQMAPEDWPRCLFIAVHALPPPIVEQVLECTWEAGGPALRPHLAQAAGCLIERLRPKTLGKERLAEEARILREKTGIALSLDEVRAMFESAGGPLLDLLGERTEGPLSGKALAFWKRFGERILPYDIRHLEYALEVGPDRATQETALDRYLERRADAEAMLDEIRAADGDACVLAAAAIERRLLERYERDPAALAGAFLKAMRTGAPRPFLARIAKALLNAAGSRGPYGPVVDAALPVARVVVAGKPGKRRKTGAGPRSKARSRSTRGRKAQLDLFEAGDEERRGSRR